MSISIPGILIRADIRVWRNIFPLVVYQLDVCLRVQWHHDRSIGLYKSVRSETRDSLLDTEDLGHN